MKIRCLVDGPFLSKDKEYDVLSENEDYYLVTTDKGDKWQFKKFLFEIVEELDPDSEKIELVSTEEDIETAIYQHENEIKMLKKMKVCITLMKEYGIEVKFSKDKCVFKGLGK